MSFSLSFSIRRGQWRLTVDHKELVLEQGIDPLYSSGVEEEIEREEKMEKERRNKGRDGKGEVACLYGYSTELERVKEREEERDCWQRDEEPKEES